MLRYLKKLKYLKNGRDSKNSMLAERMVREHEFDQKKTARKTVILNRDRSKLFSSLGIKSQTIEKNSDRKHREVDDMVFILNEKLQSMFTTAVITIIVLRH